MTDESKTNHESEILKSELPKTADFDLRQSVLKLREQDGKIQEWYDKVDSGEVPTVAFPAADIIKIWFKFWIFSLIMILGSSLILSTYFVLLASSREGFILQDLGPIVSFTVNMMSRLATRGHSEAFRGWADFYALGFSGLWLFIRDMFASLRVALWSVTLLITSAYLSKALTISGCMAAYFVFWVLLLIDPATLVAALIFLLAGTLSQKFGRWRRARVDPIKAYWLSRRRNKYGRGATQVFSNSLPACLPVISILFWYVCSPGRLSSDIAPYTNIFVTQSPPIPVNNIIDKISFSIILYMTSFARYITGARDLIMTTMLRTTLAELDLPFLFRWGGRVVAMALAANCGDSLSSDIGQSFGLRSDNILTRSYNILNLRKVPKGINGGVSIVGLISAYLGGAMVMFGYEAAADTSLGLPVLLMMAMKGGMIGLLASLSDSILGATLQPNAVDIFGFVMKDQLAALVSGLHALGLLEQPSHHVKELAKRVLESAGDPIVNDSQEHLFDVMSKSTVHMSKYIGGMVILDNSSVNFLNMVLVSLVVSLLNM